MSPKEKDETFFVVWLINHVARAWNMTTADTYRLLQNADIVNAYLFEHYEVLHTMGQEALVEDVTILAKNKGLIS